MKCRKAIVAAVAFLLMLGCRQLLAWNSVGHMTVAYAAYQRLSEVEKARAAVLLKLNPYYPSWLTHIPPGTSDSDRDMYVFLMAATWPDQIKAMGSHYVGNDNAPHAEVVTLNGGYNDHQAHKYWHFVDTPFSTDGTALPMFSGPSLPQKIAVLRAALASKEDDALKSYDLVWLLHLVGDAHQPLHCATRVSSAKPHGDDGGNLVLVNGPAKELHAFWDGALGAGDTRDYMAAVKVGATLREPDQTLLNDDKVEDWVAESFALAKSSVYIDPVGPGLGPFTMTDAYTAKAHQIVLERTALAGARLANLLKAALQCNEKTCVN